MVCLKEGNIPLKSVIFDLANVLIEYDPGAMMLKLGIAPERVDRLLEITAFRPEWDEWDRGFETKESIRALAKADEPDFADDIDLYLSRWEEQFIPIPWNVETFYQLKKAGVKVYILSNWMQDCYEDWVIDHNPFIKDADGVMISYEVLLNKPDPAIFRLLLDRYQIDPKSAVFFDDREQNIASARSVGLNACQILDNGPVLPFLDFQGKE